MSDIKNIAKRIKQNSRSLPLNRSELEMALEVLIHKVLFPTFDRDEDEIELQLSIFKNILSNGCAAASRF